MSRPFGDYQRNAFAGVGANVGADSPAIAARR
jgi:hypothetical protein